MEDQHNDTHIQKGDKENHNNYRGINLTALKLTTKVLTSQPFYQRKVSESEDHA